MLFVTNGTTRDLPQDQPFEFWDGQVDWGRAYKIAKIQQSEKMSPAVAPRHDLDVHIMLEAVASDRYKSFTSRPAGEPIAWCRWAEFCRWFFDHDFDNRWYIVNEIRRGEIYRWYPRFAAWADKYGQFARYCCETDKIVDDTIFWDGHNFDKKYCRSDRQIPATFPTPEELEGIAAWGELLGGIFGTDEAAKFIDNPPSPAQRAASFDPSPPPSVDDLETPPKAPPPDMSEEDVSWVWGAAFGGLAIVAATVLFRK